MLFRLSACASGAAAGSPTPNTSVGLQHLESECARGTSIIYSPAVPDRSHGPRHCVDFVEFGPIPERTRGSVTLLLTITERHLRPRWTRLGRMVPSRLPVPHGGGPGHRKGQGVQRGTNGSRSWRWKSVHGRTYPTLLRARPATRCCPVHPTPKAGYIMKVHQDRIFGIFSVALGIKTTFI